MRSCSQLAYLVKLRLLYGEKHLCPQGKNPGAQEQDKTRLLPNVLPQMSVADTVVVHVGSIDISRASSEHLKMDIK